MRTNALKFEIGMIPRKTSGDTKYTVYFDTPTETVVSKEMTYDEACALRESIHVRIINSGAETIGSFNSHIQDNK